MCNVLKTGQEELKFIVATNRKENMFRKRVRFPYDDKGDVVKAEILGPLLEPASALSEEEKSEIWWMRSDFETFSSHARLLARETALREKDDKKGYKMVFLGGYLACEREAGPTESQKHYLRQWTKVAFSRRGIERWCIEDLDDLRADRRKKSISAVLDAQDCSGNMTRESRIEFIKSAYVSRTLGARRFAVLLAEGDQHAVRSRSSPIIKRSCSSSTGFSTLSSGSFRLDDESGSGELRQSKPEERRRRGSKILLRFRRRDSVVEKDDGIEN